MVSVRGGRASRTGAVAALAITAFMMVGCGPAIVPSVAPDLLRYTCGRFPFGPEVLDITSSDEVADTPEAAALRTHLAGPGPDIDFLPDHGWKLVGADATGAEFVSVSDGDPGMVNVLLERGQAGWRVSGWGQCRPSRLLPDGLGSADWWLLPGEPRPGPATRTFEALVSERACASGRPADGRIAGPDVVGVNLLVLVTFAVRPLEGVQNCQGNPASRVTVDLGEPLGNRTLLDGGALPPREPVEP